MHKRLYLFIAGSALLVVACQSASSDDQASKGGGAQPAGNYGKTYTQVQAVFTANCLNCHSSGRKRAGLVLETYDGVMKGSQDGPVVTPGNPDGSMLSRALHGLPGVKKMPPRNDLPPDSIKLIDDWIKSGAKSDS